MKKVIAIIVAFIILIILFGMIGYFNHDKIDSFIDNEEWLEKSVFSTQVTEDVLAITSNNYLVTYTNNSVNFYSSDGKIAKTFYLNSNSIKLAGSGAYTTVFDEDASMLYLYKDTTLLWEKKVPSQLKKISVNKNGYVATCYLPNGYKSGVTLYNSQGEALVTSYLASTYAVSTVCSKDNRYLYIAEVNISGISPQSFLRVIDLNNKTDKKEIINKKIISNEIITDISCTSQDEIIILTDSGMYKISPEYNAKSIYSFDEKDTMYATITDTDFPYVIEQDFTNDTILRIFAEEIINIKLPTIPELYETMANKLAIRMDNEVIVYSNSQKEIARISLTDNVVGLKFIKDANVLALIYKNKIEFVRL